MCFHERHDFAFMRGTAVPVGKGKNTRFLVFFLSRESRFCFRERHGCAFTRVTVVPLENGKDMFSVCFLPRESRFASTRGTVVISREARACLFRKGKKPCSRFGFFARFFTWFFREKKIRQNLSTWDLILKISTRGIQS